MVNVIFQFLTQSRFWNMHALQKVAQELIVDNTWTQYVDVVSFMTSIMFSELSHVQFMYWYSLWCLSSWLNIKSAINNPTGASRLAHNKMAMPYPTQGNCAPDPTSNASSSSRWSLLEIVLWLDPLIWSSMGTHRTVAHSQLLSVSIE